MSGWVSSKRFRVVSRVFRDRCPGGCPVNGFGRVFRDRCPGGCPVNGVRVDVQRSVSGWVSSKWFREVSREFRDRFREGVQGVQRSVSGWVSSKRFRVDVQRSVSGWVSCKRVTRWAFSNRCSGDGTCIQLACTCDHFCKEQASGRCGCTYNPYPSLGN